MVKKRGLVVVVMFVLALVSADLYFFKKSDSSHFALSGMVIEKIPEIFSGLDLNFPLFALIVAIVVIILIIFILYRRFLKNKENKKSKNDYQIIKQKKTKAGTDLDVLYNLVKTKKIIGIGTISHIFNISKEKSLEWAKILENHNLVIIEYPTFSDPKVKIAMREAEENSEIKEEKKENKKEEIKKNEKSESAKNNKKAKDAEIIEEAKETKNTRHNKPKRKFFKKKTTGKK